MEFNENLFENIIVIGKSSGGSVLDDIEAQEEKIENKDLYDAMLAINKVLEAPSRYSELQSVTPSMNVNDGTVTVTGVTKQDIKAQSQDSSQDAVDYVDSIIDEFVNDLSASIPSNLKVKHEILDDELPKMDKKQFVVVISRKG